MGPGISIQPRMNFGLGPEKKEQAIAVLGLDRGSFESWAQTQ